MHDYMIGALPQDEEDEGDDEPGRVDEVKTGRDVDAGEDEREEGLHPQEIDAYWLQRRIAQAFTDIDADASQKLAEEVLVTLQVWRLHLGGMVSIFCCMQCCCGFEWSIPPSMYLRAC